MSTATTSRRHRKRPGRRRKALIATLATTLVTHCRYRVSDITHS